MNIIPSELILYIMEKSYPLDALCLKLTCIVYSCLTPKYIHEHFDKYKLGNIFEVSKDEDYNFAKYGHMELVRHTRYPNLCFEMACNGGQIDIINLMTSENKSEDLNYINGLHFACSGGCLDAVKLIIVLSRELKHNRGIMKTAFYKACESGNTDVVQYIMNLGYCYEYGMHSACEYGHVNIFELLNKRLSTKGFNINPSKWMNIACKFGHVSIINLLIELGANDFNGGMTTACSFGHLEAVKLLIDKSNGNVNLNACLVQACNGNHIEIVKLLINKGASKYDIPLSVSCLNNNQHIIKLLVSSGLKQDDVCGYCHKIVSRHVLLKCPFEMSF
jgi:hypothetical protein